MWLSQHVTVPYSNNCRQGRVGAQRCRTVLECQSHSRQKLFPQWKEMIKTNPVYFIITHETYGKIHSETEQSSPSHFCQLPDTSNRQVLPRAKKYAKESLQKVARGKIYLDTYHCVLIFILTLTHKPAA